MIGGALGAYVLSSVPGETIAPLISAYLLVMGALVLWKAQLRLCARFRRLVAAGKNANVVTTAVAREMAAFAWAIASAVRSAGAAA